MKKISSLIGAGAALLMMASCAGQPEVKSYNEGINIIPMPQNLVVNQGTFVLKDGMAIGAQTDGLKTVADYFASKMSASTGYDIKVSDQGIISLLMDTIQVKGQEEYWLEVKPEGVTVTARTPQGAFYGMQSLMQLFPAEIESTVPVEGIAWEASAVSIKDYPRFAYRGRESLMSAPAPGLRPGAGSTAGCNALLPDWQKSAGKWAGCPIKWEVTRSRLH